MDYIWLILSIIGLSISSDYLVINSQKIAAKCRLSSTTFGALIVGPATSLPELVVSIEAMTRPLPDIVFGNALGSVIANTSLILATSLLLVPSIVIQRQTIVWQLFDVLTLALCFVLSQTNWLLSLLLLLVYGLRAYGSSRLEHDLKPVKSTENLWLLLGVFLLALAVLLFSSELLIDSCRSIAIEWGVSDLVIGLSIVALGTSLPELATNLSSIKHGDYQLAIGNIMGSNTVCLLVIAPIVGWWGQFPIPMINLTRDIPIILVLNAAVLLHTYLHWKSIVPMLLIVLYAAYQLLLYLY